MSAKVTIHIRCPQCGGDIDFLEEATVIRCQYCGSSLLVAGRNGIHRYVLQPRQLEGNWAETRAIEHLRSRGRHAPRPAETFLFYAPFWRIRGTVYRWIFGREAHAVDSFTGGAVKERKKLLRTRVLDHTIPGFEDLDLGLSSLGVRAQVLELHEFRKEHLDKRASFLPLDVSLDRVRKEAHGLSEAYLDSDDIIADFIHHLLVNRRFSVIYAPLWYVECHHQGGRETLLIDALAGDVVHHDTEGSPILIKLMGEKTRKPFKFEEIQFLPFRCPNCGWDLPFRPLSVLHFCHTCRRLWQERRGDWSEVTYRSVSPPKERLRDARLWVPFWRYRVVLQSSEERLETMADLYRIAPPPRALKCEIEARRPIYFFVPAIPLRDPRQIHNLASRISFLQPEVVTDSFPDGSEPLTAGASMGHMDARELWSVILGGMIPYNHRLARAWLQESQAELYDPLMLYFPFEQTHLLWRELLTGLAFQRNALTEDPPKMTA